MLVRDVVESATEDLGVLHQGPLRTRLALAVTDEPLALLDEEREHLHWETGRG